MLDLNPVDDDGSHGEEDHEEDDEGGDDDGEEDGEGAFEVEGSSAWEIVAAVHGAEGHVHSAAGSPEGEDDSEAEQAGVPALHDVVDVVAEGGGGVAGQNLDHGVVEGIGGAGFETLGQIGQEGQEKNKEGKDGEEPGVGEGGGPDEKVVVGDFLPDAAGKGDGADAPEDTRDVT